MDLSSEPLYEHDTDSHANRQAAQRAARSLAASVAKMHGAVPLPTAAQHLLEATESTEYRVPDIVAIIETDPSLAGRIMRQVNSALYGHAPCTSIAQAVTLLGARMLRAMAITASALELFGKEEEPLAREVAEHGARTGTIARRFAIQCGLPADEMYTCGLLHDVGKLMLLRGSDLDYPDLLARCRGFEELHVREREQYGFDHALLAGHVLGAWKLPHPLPRIVAWHHQPERAYRGQGQLQRRVAVLRIADMLAHVPIHAGADEAWTQLSRMRVELELVDLTEDVLIELCAELLPPHHSTHSPSQQLAEQAPTHPQPGQLERHHETSRHHHPTAEPKVSHHRIAISPKHKNPLGPAATSEATALRAETQPTLPPRSARPNASPPHPAGAIASPARPAGPGLSPPRPAGPGLSPPRPAGPGLSPPRPAGPGVSPPQPLGPGASPPQPANLDASHPQLGSRTASPARLPTLPTGAAVTLSPHARAMTSAGLEAAAGDSGTLPTANEVGIPIDTYESGSAIRIEVGAPRHPGADNVGQRDAAAMDRPLETAAFPAPHARTDRAADNHPSSSITMRPSGRDPTHANAEYKEGGVIEEGRFKPSGETEGCPPTQVPTAVIGPRRPSVTTATSGTPPAAPGPLGPPLSMDIDMASQPTLRSVPVSVAIPPRQSATAIRESEHPQSSTPFRAAVAAMIFLVGGLLGREASGWFPENRRFILWILLGSAANGLLVWIATGLIGRRSDR